MVGHVWRVCVLLAVACMLASCAVGATGGGLGWFVCLLILLRTAKIRPSRN